MAKTGSRHRPTEDEYLRHLARGAERAGLSPARLVTPSNVFFDSSGVRLHYLDWGSERPDAPPLLLLHGGGLNAHTWDLCALMLRASYHCYALDLRGHGDSAWDPAGDYSIDAHARDVQQLLVHLGLAMALLIGMSLGALTALRFTTRFGSMVERLVIIDAVPRLPEGAGRQALRQFYESPIFPDLDAAVAHAQAFNKRRDSESLRFSLNHSLRQLEDGSLTWKMDMRHRSDRNMADHAAAMKLLWQDCERITQPVLLVRGAESAVLSDELAQSFASGLENARVVTVPAASHNVQGDNPAGLLQAMSSFLIY
jgi:esterase